jgi:hypothetical protein
MGEKILEENLSPVQPGFPEINGPKVLAIAESEMHKHRWGFFMDPQPSAGQDGKSLAVRGCLPCQKRLDTIPEFVNHLWETVLPRIRESSK